MFKKSIVLLFLFSCFFLGAKNIKAFYVLEETDSQCRGFSVRYHLNDGNDVRETFVGLNSNIYIETPYRSGYNFAGWYYDYNLTKPVNEVKASNLSNSYKIKSNIVCPAVNLYAKWENQYQTVNKYQNCDKGFKLRYYYNNGKNNDEVFVRYDGIFGLTIPTREGYKFAGWYYDYNFTVPVTVQKESQLSDRYKVSTGDGCEIISIYAKWEQIRPQTITEQSCGGFNIRYQMNDGSNAKQVFVRSDDMNVYLETPVRKGYQFAGWYYDYSLTKPVNVARTCFLANEYKIESSSSCPTINVYAKWEKIQTVVPTTKQNTTKTSQLIKTEQLCGGFNIRYQMNDGSNAKQVFVKSDDMNVYLDTPVRKGYQFAGWYYDQNLTKPVNVARTCFLANEYKIESSSSCPTLDVYAKWEKIQTVVPTTTTLTTQTTTKATKSVLTEQSCGGFNLNYQTNDGNAAKQVFIKSNDNSIYLETPIRNGYQFAGWYYDYSLTVPVSDVRAAYLSNSYKVQSVSSCPVLNIYAKWEKIPENTTTSVTHNSSSIQNCGGFNVKYQTNYGDVLKEEFVGYNMTTLDLYEPVKDGYDFAGWYYDYNYTNPVKTTKLVYLSQAYFMSNNSCPYINLYAKWVKKYGSSEASVSIPEYMTNSVKNVEIKKYDSEEIVKFKEIKELSKVKYEAYEIDLYDTENNKIQPTGMVSIELEIPEYLNKHKIVVYRVEGGKLIKYDTKLVNGKVIFETDHFSTYIMAENKVGGINTTIIYFIIIGVLLTFGIVWIQKNVKKIVKSNQL